MKNVESINEEGHGWQKGKSNVFSINSIVVLILFILLISFYALFTTNVGQEMVRFILSNHNMPIFTLLLIFCAAPLSAYIGNKSEDLRDSFVVNISFVALLMTLLLYPQVSKQPMILDMNKVLSFGLHFRIDQLTFMLMVMACSLWFFSLTYAHEYMAAEEEHRTRFNFWMMITFGGVMGALMSRDLLSLFLFFEIMYLSCYFLVAHNQTEGALQAGNRYIYMGVVGGLCILLSMSILYAMTNTFALVEINQSIKAIWATDKTSLVIALTSMLIGLSIKSAVFPLHFWLPDAHSNAPTPASAILSGMVIKVYIFSVIKILFVMVGLDILKEMPLSSIITSLAIVGMIMGSVLAIGQKDIKKILAYSSVAQVGYLLLGIGLTSELGLSATFFHIVTHALMKSILFLSAGAIIFQKGKRDVRDFQGIGYEMPITMTVFSIGAFSMIGIPGLIGFMSKWYLSLASLSSGKQIYVIMIMVSSFLNAMYYLPIIITAFLKHSGKNTNKLSRDKVPNTMLAPMVLIAGAIILFGFFPQWLMSFIEKAIVLL